MRYKFRGMDIQGRWFYGNLAIVPKDTANHKAGHYISNSAGMPFAYRIRPETVGQQLIFKDQEFYEGDLLKVSIFSHNTGKLIVEQTAPLEYRDCKFGVMFGSEFTCLDGFSNTTFEVVGTLYDGEVRA